MLAVSNAHSKLNILDAIQLRKVGVDDYSAVRYVHAASLRLRRVSPFSNQEIAAFSELVYSAQYLDTLQGEDLYVACLDGEIVGTAGWCPSGNTGHAARICSAYVRPLFAGLGIGRFLVEAAETRALNAGFQDVSVRATTYALGFFDRLGYTVTSHGVRLLPSHQDLPVVFMRKHLRAPSAIRSVTSRRGKIANIGSRQHDDVTVAVPRTASL